MKFMSLANRNFKEIYRDPITILLGLIMPVGLFFLFSSLFKKAQIDTFSPQSLAPSITIFAYAFIIMFSAVLIAKDKQSSLMTRLFTTPLKPFDFILGYIIPFIPFAIMQTVVCFIFGAVYGADYSNLLMASVVLLLMAIISICLGTILGTNFSLNQVSGIGSILITVVSLFSGAWMDLKMVGGMFDKIGYILPFAHSIDALKSIVNGNSFSQISTNMIWVTGYTILLVVLSVFSFKKLIKRG